MNQNSIPHLRIVVSVTAFVLVCFAAVSAWVLIYSNDDVTKGNIIGSWQNFALLAIGFWIGSSSGGKSRGTPSGEPQPVTVQNKPGEPVLVEERSGAGEGEDRTERG